MTQRWPVAPNLQDQLLTECLHPRSMLSRRKVAFEGAAPLDILLLSASERAPEPCDRDRRIGICQALVYVFVCADDLSPM